MPIQKVQSTSRHSAGIGMKEIHIPQDTSQEPSLYIACAELALT